MKELAIVTLTPRGLELGNRLAKALGRGEVLSSQGSTPQLLEELFCAGRPLACIMAIGIVVRLLGPLMKDKATEPPVVVIDEASRFAVSLLGGHGAGANALAQEIAHAIQATPVITTASDVLGLPAIDLIGHRWGWKIESREHFTEVAAAVVRGESIAVFQEAGRRDWWMEFGEWPAQFQRIKSPPQGNWKGVLLISDRWQPAYPFPTVIYRPPTLVLGVGCRRGVPCAEIESLFQHVCRMQGFSPLSLGLVATAAIKANEPGLCEFAALHGVPIRSFTVEELGSVADLPTPSEMVRARIGVRGVAEPAAMLAAYTTELLMPKYRGRHITMALARREEA